MKKRNREINIFSMSALDLFASAMGAFLLIAVMALPYYLKTDKDLVVQVEKLQKELHQIKALLQNVEKKLKKAEQENKKIISSNNDLQKKLENVKQKNKALKSENDNLKKQAKNMQKELSKTFCVIRMGWKSEYGQDVDLYVIDPLGNTFKYNARTFPNSTASLTIDAGYPTKAKNGDEVWIAKKLIQGTYTIKYKYVSGKGPLKITGSVFTKSFTKDLPTKTMKKGEYKKITTIIVDIFGNATLEAN